MGRKSRARNPQSIRSALKGLRNRWGRFQCPRDGSICKSLEAWHWHRLKYHASQHIDFIDLDGKTTNSSSSSSVRRPPSLDSPLLSPAGNTLTAVIPLPRLLQLPPLSPSDRLLPPEAFAPLRPEVAFPDDVSDLTEPELPVLLSEEVTTVAPPDDEIVNSTRTATGKETNSEHKNSKQDRETPSHGFPIDLPLHSHALDTASNWKQPAAVVECDGQNSTDHQTKDVEHFASGDQSVSTSNRGRTSIQSTFTDQESIFKMISMQVIEMFDPQQTMTLESVLPRVEQNFSRWGLSREVIVGVVTGTLVGAVDCWKRGYEAGWRDGAKEVLRAPLLTNLALHRPTPEKTP